MSGPSVLSEVAAPLKQTAAEISAGVTPVNFGYAPGNVLRYGADPTGASDSSVAINSAIASNGRVFFPDGTFKITSKIVITKANRVLSGNGPTSIIQSSAASFDLFEARANDIVFDSLAFYGSAPDNSTTQFAVFTAAAFASLRLQVYRCYFGGAASNARLNNGVKYDTAWNYGTISFCTFDTLQGTISGTGYGCLAGQATGLAFSNNTYIGGASQGRHVCYLSGGCTYCIVIGNRSTGANFEHYPMNSAGAQPANAYNIIANNTCIGGVTLAAHITGQISIFGSATANLITGNQLINSADKGILINATVGVTDYTSIDNQIIGNDIQGAGEVGIDISGSTRTFVSGNRVKDSSSSYAGTYANIRLVTSNLGAGSQAVTDCTVIGNYCSGATNPRSSLQFNASSPIPTGTFVGYNRLEVGAVTDFENAAGASFRTPLPYVGYGSRRIVVTYSASMTFDASQGNEFDITATNNTAFTINAPTNPIDGQRITVTIRNTSGGALGAITFNAAFKLATFTAPATANSRSVDFRYDGSNWVQVSQTGVDVPN